MSKDLFEPLSAYSDMDWKSRWQANHGNWLLAFSALVCVGGVIAITFSTSGVPVEAASAPSGAVGPSLTLPVSEDGSVIIPPADSTFVVRVSGATSDSGLVRIAVYENAESFNVSESALISESVAINREGTAIVPIPVDSIPEVFSIAAYHDINGDGELNRNLLGIPTEPYGFSNNARTMVGPPEFEDTVVARPEPGTVLNLPIW